MNSDLILSIIIPLYNTQKLVRRCIESILSQKVSAEQYEIIIVNDGSTDNSLEVVNHYDCLGNVMVVSQENRGVSIARQRGVSMAKGKYLMFVDSDDELCEDSLPKVFEEITTTTCDIFLFGLMHSYESGSKPSSKKCYANQSNVKPSVYLSRLLTGVYDWGPVGKVFKRELIANNSSAFVPNLAVGEDLVMNTRLGGSSSTISVYDILLYNYIHRENSVTQHSKQEWERSFYVDGLVVHSLLDCGLGSVLLKEILLFRSNWLFDYFMSGQSVPEEGLSFLLSINKQIYDCPNVVSREKQYLFRMMARPLSSKIGSHMVKLFGLVKRSIGKSLRPAFV